MLDRTCDLCGFPGIVHGGMLAGRLMRRTPRNTKIHIYTYRISTRSREMYVCAWCVLAIERARDGGVLPRLGGV